MATIKRNGNLIVLKSGKVSCTCCGQEGCCMYPAIGFGTIDDLPDTITSSAETLSKLDDAIEFALPDGSGNFTMYYGTYTSPLESEGVGLFNNQWAYKVDGGSLAGVTRDCLINEICFSEQDPDWFCDNFADSYTINGGPLGPIIVTRQSLCEWTGLDSCGELASLFFEEDGLFFGWNVIVPDYFGEGECNRLDAQEGQKEGFQNTPTGLYTNNLSVS